MAVLLAGLLLVGQALTDGVDECSDSCSGIPPIGVGTAEQLDDPAAELVNIDVEAPRKPLSPRDYLYATYPVQARRLDCMIRGESSWLPWAQNGKYLGLAQFDYPTWMETPPGRAGLSRADPIASIDAMAWGVVHLGYGRWPVTSRRC